MPQKPGKIELEEVVHDLDAAKRILRETKQYSWLLAGPAMFNVVRVQEAFADRGMQVSDDAIRRWFSYLPRTETHGSRIGMWANRDDLIVYFARRLDAGLGAESEPA